MKKMYLSAAVVAALAASCSSEEEYVVENLAQDDVSFGTYVDMQTKALEKNSFATGDQLCINAFQSTGSMIGQQFTNNFMKDEILTRTASGWTYTNTRFWPNDEEERISFVASYPAIYPAITHGICSFGFAVDANPASQRDFMWSTITDATRSDRNGTHQNGVVEEPATRPLTDVVLHFRHALSKVTFNAKAATYYGGATITVTGITVSNLFAEGTYSLTEDLERGSWKVSGLNNNGYTALADGTDEAINTYYKSFGTSLLMIPQELPTGEGAPAVTINYTVEYENPARTLYEERTFNLGSADVPAWEQDKVYNYNFNIGLDMITFGAVIESWGETETAPEMSIN